MAGSLDSPLIKKCRGLPLKAVESVIFDSIDHLKDNWHDIQFLLLEMSQMGYNDEPDFDKEGKPILRRTTPLHIVARGDLPRFIDENIAVRELFGIYKLDLNYIDEFGLTHFHVACTYGYTDIVQKFLDLGQNPNLLVAEIYDSPLLLALNWYHKEVAELLLRRGADPNLPNKNGLTPLHLTCQRNDGGKLVEFFFEINDKLNKLVQVNSLDKFGNTPLHFAIFCGNEKIIELLLRRGSDSNLRNAEGSTPLHIICHRYCSDDLAGLFFKINEELNQAVQVNAVDSYGRTPLQLAVASILPNSVDILLNNGADLSSFVFPADSYFGKALDPLGYDVWVTFELRVATGALLIVERLERSGYDLDRSDALMIMKLFIKCGLFEKSVDLEKRLSDDKFVIQAKEIMVKPNLSLCDLIRLPPREAKKRITLKEYYDFSSSGIPFLKHRKACLEHLCEKLSRRFFQSWALDPLMELTCYRLPILCCDIITEKLQNEDLFNICLAVTGQSS